jgi:S-adenosylmethionine:tRNA ribosyltransferase-isomerase
LQDRDQRDDVKLTALARIGGGAWVFRAESEESPRELLARVGHVPLPHYIRGGNMVDKDLQSYQTVYAVNDGAVAAPTAGLHFTEPLLKKLKEQGVGFARVTLHVGLGTFSPIKSDFIEDHEMHAEMGSVEQEAVDSMRQTRAQGGRVIGVGTTSMRVLETAARSGELDCWEGETNLYIRPPFDFHAVDGLLTNFHFPRTTLLVLVRTFGGDELIKRAYEEAIAERYRLFSYGDAMLIV